MGECRGAPCWCTVPRLSTYSTSLRSQLTQNPPQQMRPHPSTEADTHDRLAKQFAKYISRQIHHSKVATLPLGRCRISTELKAGRGVWPGCASALMPGARHETLFCQAIKPLISSGVSRCPLSAIRSMSSLLQRIVDHCHHHPHPTETCLLLTNGYVSQGANMRAASGKTYMLCLFPTQCSQP